MYNNAPLEKPVTLSTLRQQKMDEEKISCVALYDAPMASLAQQAGVDIVLVGDSLGMTVQGHDSTLPVTIEQMAYHTAAVKRGNKKSFIIADLPFMTYGTPKQAMTNAAILMQAGAHAIKLEGGHWLCDTIAQLSQQGVPVCAHLGLTPQSVNKLGGYRVQGREEQQAEQILVDASALAAAGADLLVLECVPSALAKKISDQVDLITIGIGAGADAHGQVLVINDLLGITPKLPKFAHDFLADSDSIVGALQRFTKAVKTKTFPATDNQF